jgi:glycosyltransferase involved in cell wall biosynthesis
MRVMIDATSLARTITGIENYTLNLTKNMLEMSSNGEFHILVRGKIPLELKKYKHAHFYVSKFASQLLTEQIWIPFMYHKLKPDIIHFPAFPPSPLIRKNMIFTVHDATMWKFKDTLSLKNKLYMKPLSEIGLRRAKKILTVSNSSENEIGDVFPRIKNKIYNTGISVSDEIKQTDISLLKQEEIKEIYKLPDKYFLTVGSLEPRKNLLFLIESFVEYVKRVEQPNKLIITGRAAWGSKEIHERVKQANIQEYIVFTGYVPDDDLTVLYSLADYFVFPSIYEGFGLPVLEAMKHGTPVITSNSSSIPEVAGEAGIYFSPYDKDELIEILLNTHSNKEIRKIHSELAIKRSEKFSWGNVAKKIYALYKIND